MSYTARVDFVVKKLNEKFGPQVQFRRVLMKDTSFKIESSQEVIFTNSGKRRRVSEARIKKAIAEFNNQYLEENK